MQLLAQTVLTSLYVLLAYMCTSQELLQGCWCNDSSVNLPKKPESVRIALTVSTVLLSCFVPTETGWNYKLSGL